MTKQTRPTWTRRRVLTVLAGMSTLALGGATRAEMPERLHWRGSALGANASIVLYHGDEAVAREAVRACLQEIERLEKEFSLYRSDSAISCLNRDGVLNSPSQDMRLLLSGAKRFGYWSDGAFDVTLQPLWRLYADHFTRFPSADTGPPEDELQTALKKVDFRRIRITPSRIELEPGTTITLNGIAQGYITDRVAALLRSRGWVNVLIDLGETRALGSRIDGTPWRIGIRSPGGAKNPLLTVPLAGQAFATSGGYGTAFERSGRYHHLFDPSTGRSVNRYRSVSVMAPEAATADALSTALYVASRPTAERLMQKAGPATAWLIGAGDTVEKIES